MHHDIWIWLPTFGLPLHTALMIYVMLFILGVSLYVRKSLKLIPGRLQSVFELVIEMFVQLGSEVMGPKGKPFVPWIVTFFLFILVSNALGMIPGLAPPTMNLNTTFGLAIIVFVLTHVIGLREHGIGYIKHFMGPNIWIAPIMFPIEIVSHVARPVSLSMRLFGNMMGHEVLVGVLVGMMPISILLYGFSAVLGILVVVIQAYIFALLSMAYLGGALDEAH